MRTNVAQAFDIACYGTIKAAVQASD
jgi:hypothetical protein